MLLFYRLRRILLTMAHKLMVECYSVPHWEPRILLPRRNRLIISRMFNYRTCTQTTRHTFLLPSNPVALCSTLMKTTSLRYGILYYFRTRRFCTWIFSIRCTAETNDLLRFLLYFPFLGILSVSVTPALPDASSIFLLLLIFYCSQLETRTTNQPSNPTSFVFFDALFPGFGAAQNSQDILCVFLTALLSGFMQGLLKSCHVRSYIYIAFFSHLSHLTREGGSVKLFSWNRDKFHISLPSKTTDAWTTHYKTIPPPGNVPLAIDHL